MSWFAAAFDSLPDRRTGNAQRHDLLEVLTIALTASVCGIGLRRGDLLGFRRFRGGSREAVP
jgi:hypothetical protein